MSDEKNLVVDRVYVGDEIPRSLGWGIVMNHENTDPDKTNQDDSWNVSGWVFFVAQMSPRFDLGKVHGFMVGLQLGMEDDHPRTDGWM